ncbi:MAG TPA: proprotein convertase P-domain-containing protein [Phycisphaerales bacterium]|nr:proprotein convertase P-domain-containing protein [Phycisphaerales bacterium]
MKTSDLFHSSSFGRHRRTAVAVAMIGLIGVCATFADAQRTHVKGTQPSAVTHHTLPLDAVDVQAMPSLNIQAIDLDDYNRDLNGDPPRYAIPNPASLTPDNSGTWEHLDPQTMLWRLRIQSPNAKSINFGFTHYHMPQGGQLFIYATDMSDVMPPFTAKNNADHNQLWTPPIRSNDVMIEVTIPQSQQKALDLELGSINLGYRGFGAEGPNEGGIASGSCNIDVVCSIADGWRDQIPGVAVISTGGSTFCTGFTINNTANDKKPYFMTAFHCGITASNAASLVTFWNFENSTCRPIGSAASGGPGDGSLTEFNTGATFRAASSTSDFTLVELSQPIDPSYNVTYLGWDRSGTNPTSGACIHHPNTDEKRISFFDPTGAHPDLPSHDSSWGCTPYPGTGADGTHIAVYWGANEGITEPGSSGSPLFDNNHRVIGQLHGGPSSCSATGDNRSDCYGRFSRSWTGGGTSATRLSDWLDPLNTGAMTLDTIGRGISVSPSGIIVSEGVVGGPFTNSSTVYTLSNTTGSSANYNVSIVGGGTAPVTLNGGAGPVSGSLANGGTVNVTVALAAAANSLSAGTYSTDVLFQDTTNNLSLTSTRQLEIGLVNFSTSPANDLVTGGPVGGPFSGTQVYTVTNTKPTAVTVQISANQPWITIIGGAGPVNVNLASQGASQNVTIGIGGNSNTLAQGLYNGTVSFTSLSGGTGNTTRAVQLDVGRFTYIATGLPLAVPDSGSASVTINVPDTYCVGDVDVELTMTHSWVGDLKFVLSHNDIPVAIIDRPGVPASTNGCSADNFNDIIIDDEGTLPIENQCTANLTSPPNYTPNESLSAWDGTQVGGDWTLTISDNASSDTGSLIAWKLKIASSGNTCPPPPVLTTVYSFPLDTNPGWTTQGQWAFGQPTGGGSHNLDPTSGFTGTNVYGYNLAGDYPNSLSPTQYLTTTAINCTGLTGTRVRFKRWLGVENSTYDHANLQVSNNGSTWTDVFVHTATSAIADTTWTTQEYSISSVADNQPTVYLRWGMGTTDTSVTYPGWNIDDIEIRALVPQCAPDIAPPGGDGVVNIDDLTAVILAWGTSNATADINNDGNVNIDDLTAIILGWGACP